MNGGNLIDRFQFNNHTVFNNQIQPVSTIDMDPFILDGQRFFSFHLEPSLRQLINETTSIS